MAGGKIDTHSCSIIAVYSLLYIGYVSEVTKHYAAESDHACCLGRTFFCDVIGTMMTHIQHTSRFVGLHGGRSVLNLSVVHSIIALDFVANYFLSSES